MCARSEDSRRSVRSIENLSVDELFLDRLIGDTVAEAFANVQKLLRYGVRVVSYTEAYFRTSGPAGEFIIPNRGLDRAATAHPDGGAHQNGPGYGARSDSG